MNWRYFRCKLRTLIFLSIIGLYTTCVLLLQGRDSNRSDGTQEKIGRESGSRGAGQIQDVFSMKTVIGVLVLVCNRLTVIRTLNQILKYRPSADKFPVVVSFDCDKEGEDIQSQLSEIYLYDELTYIKHPNYWKVHSTLDNVRSHLREYYQLAAHYHWALNYMFMDRGYKSVIIIEDDLDISPDFFEYFTATHPLLEEDSSLWCISAYNDNGKPLLIDRNSPDLLHRSDFFPGLGWMLQKSLWDELNSKWPKGFWDDWMRLPEQRKDRACIRPEISRSKTYGRMGASSGQYFDEHLKTIVLNNKSISFTKMDLSYLKKAKYDKLLIEKLKSSDVISKPHPQNVTFVLEKIKKTLKPSSILLKCENAASLQNNLNRFGLMSDTKSGIHRGAYQGVVQFSHKGMRIYLVSEADYDKLLSTP